MFLVLEPNQFDRVSYVNQEHHIGHTLKSLDIQDYYHYLPKEIFPYVAKAIGVGEARDGMLHLSISFLQEEGV